MATAYRLAQRQLRKPATDGGRELEAVPRARGADHDSPAPLEDELLVGRGRVETRLCPDRLRVDLGEALTHPGRDALDDRRIGRSVAVGIGLKADLVHAG